MVLTDGERLVAFVRAVSQIASQPSVSFFLFFVFAEDSDTCVCWFGLVWFETGPASDV
jgi:hypothetical protein